MCAQVYFVKFQDADYRVQCKFISLCLPFWLYISCFFNFLIQFIFKAFLCSRLKTFLESRSLKLKKGYNPCKYLTFYRFKFFWHLFSLIIMDKTLDKAARPSDSQNKYKVQKMCEACYILLRIISNLNFEDLTFLLLCSNVDLFSHSS